jgi:hypothetical protein
LEERGIDLVTDALMKRVVSKGIAYSMPSGKFCDSLSMVASTRAAVSRALEPGS